MIQHCLLKAELCKVFVHLCNLTTEARKFNLGKENPIESALILFKCKHPIQTFNTTNWLLEFYVLTTISGGVPTCDSVRS